MIIISLVILLGHSTSGQQYPNCGNCQRDDVRISQPPLSYTTMMSDGYFGTQPSNNGCTPIDGQGTINCGVGTTLMDCERGPTRNLNFSDLSPYFVWNRTSSAARNVSVVFRFDQPVNIRRITLWFWNAPRGSIEIPSLTLYSSNDNFTMPSNQINIHTSDSPAPVENRQYRLIIDITNEGLMVQSLRVMMTISQGIYIFLSEVLFCVSDIATTTTTTTSSTAAAATIISTSSIVSVLKLYSTTTVTTSPSPSTSTLSLIHNLSPTAVSNSSSSSSDVGLIVGVILAVIIITIIIIIAVVIIVVWKGKRSVSTKPEGVYYSTINEGTLQTSLPNKSEPIYSEMSDEQNSVKNISNTSPTQQHVTMQDNPAYSDPKEQVVLQDNPAYSDVVNAQVKLQDNPAYGSTSIDIKN